MEFRSSYAQLISYQLSVSSYQGNGEMGKWGNGEMGKWGNGEMGKWGNGEMGKWGNGEMGKNPKTLKP
ncbi:MAG: hypothetical protein EWV46_06030 [Microcystis viridis Mv_BB_P_19951000_S69D]|nr:MAG: hypothetical protein EWV46_06030 [Microcystis viridis Mv_BB_P_19951000_S69D]